MPHVATVPLLAAVAIATLVVAVAAAGDEYVSVTHRAGSYTVHRGRDAAGWVARANLTDTTNSTGWAHLEVEGRRHAGDAVMAFAAGLAEASATRRLIADFQYNVIEPLCAGAPERCRRVDAYLRRTVAWTRLRAAAGAGEPYWRQVALVLRQMDGLQHGIELDAPHAADNAAVWLNAVAETEDLLTWARRPAAQPAQSDAGGEHCSVLIKLLPGAADLYVAHATWVWYDAMTRLVKRVTLPFGAAGDGDRPVPGASVAFTGFPASVASLDDFHVISSGLVTTETTIGNYNRDLWQFVTPRDSVMEWVRATVANRLATSGRHWHRLFARHNSGTYNNQWMVVDYGRFAAGSAQQRDLLWVTEQLPGLVVGDDMTAELVRDGYWASYNRPYFPLVDDAGGMKRLRQSHGDYYSHDATARALIFRRDQRRVSDPESAVRLMRYNNFTADPLSACNCSGGHSATLAIAARRDLNDPAGSYPLDDLAFAAYGAIDAKLTTAELAARLEFVAESGPTHDDQPVFQWSTSPFADTERHRGQPDRWDFDPVKVTWNWAA